ncbi:FKBP-type peptidyl-prolyl cis-trans isomerase [Parasphingopyxis algicola]|uniref:FKBP-type peptidyl-prolyl cis-trans isomerase n=1 Tax=Parasphingopyxis algicola TaxID=2026624 RepID=UPI0015A28457|nr:FKBP-type peptidyl-prolyl cis-trans isomerase [Parasphingopyxis algicola]QLC25256.1 FKBP-type peptidyl-prolyl cis-trans isomerase [Parasphingopyxis algicola]
MSITAVPLRPIEKGTLTKLWIGIFLLLAGAAVFAWHATARPIAMNGTAEDFLSWNAGRSGVIETDSGLQYQVLEEGDEAGSPGAGAGVIVNYEGRLIDGTVFDANEQQGLPLDGVITGWAEGIRLMSRGARYRFWIPPALGYGEDPPPGSPIPADSVLVFDVELIDFISREQLMQIQMQQMGLGGQQPEGAAPGQ